MEIKRAAELLLQSQNPVIYAGRGIVLSNATQELIELSELLSLPVVSTPTQSDVFPTDHPLYSWDREIVSKADTLLIIGTRLSEFSTDAWTLIQNGTKIIQIDIDGFQLAKVYPLDVAILGDAKISLRELISLIKVMIDKEEEKIRKRFEELKAQRQKFIMERWPDREWDEKPIRPWRLLKDLRESLDKDAILVEDSAALGSWIRRCFDFYEPGTHYSVVSGGSMGFGFPAALGIKLAKKEKQVVCISGDGSLMMVLSALSTMVNYNIPIILLINNNQSYMQIKFRQKPPYFGSILSNPPFEKIAELFGAYAERVDEPEDLKPALQRAISANRPSVINVSTIEDPKYANPNTYFGLKPRYLSGEIPKR